MTIANRLLFAAAVSLWPCVALAQPPSPPLLTALPTVSGDWADPDTTRQLYLTSALYADYAQTRNISQWPDAFERNPFLGRHPSDHRITNYFLSTALLSFAAARALPAGWPRQSLQYSIIAVELAAIVHNKRMGLSFRY